MSGAAPIFTPAEVLSQRYLECVPGATYKHYKGGTYTVLCKAQMHDTREWLVVYFSHKQQTTNVRPLYEFCETVNAPSNGWTGPRFERVPAKE